MSLTHFILVMIGGALGSGARYGVSVFALKFAGAGWPWGTFAVNLSGSLLMGLVMGWIALKESGGVSHAQLFLATGVLGGFTTFSAFSLETLRMIEAKSYLPAAAYVGLSVLFGLIMVGAGLFIMRKVLV